MVARRKSTKAEQKLCSWVRVKVYIRVDAQLLLHADQDDDRA